MLAMMMAAGGGVRGQAGAPAPILVVVNDAAPNPYGNYLPDILHAEGLNAFSVVQLSTLDGPTLLEDQGGPGGGLQNLTLPLKGVADQYDLAGGDSVAELYTSRTLSAGRPVVVRQARTAAWAFDLARGTAYARQGDPAFAGLDRDGQAGYRTNDIFFGTIDLERVGVPHADVQMRLLSGAELQISEHVSVDSCGGVKNK